MSRITAEEAQAWADGTKLTISALDQNLCDEIESEVLGYLPLFDSSTWVDEVTTPKLVRTIIAKMYVAWLYNRTYSEDINKGSDYAALLIQNAMALITGLNDSTIELINVPATSTSFYPTDSSSAQCPTRDDPSLGPAAFSMGMRFS